MAQSFVAQQFDVHRNRLLVCASVRGVSRVVQHTETDACCFITHDTVDKCYIVAFRGTSTATNAMDDLKMNLVPFTMME